MSDVQNPPRGRASSADHELDLLVERVRGYVDQHGSLPAERKLAEQLDVKRHQLRRALKVLFSTGDLVPKVARRSPRKRSNQQFAGQIAQDSNPIEIIELRLLIEPSLARQAALRATPPMIAAIRKAAQNGPKTGQESGLHRLVALASANNLAAEFQHMLERISAEVLESWHSRALEPEAMKAHQLEIAEAIASRDPEAAECSMRSYLQAVHRRFASIEV